MREISTYLKAAGPVLWFKPILTIVLCTSHLAAALIYWTTWYDLYRFYRLGTVPKKSVRVFDLGW
jgi:hypothetical protein